MASDGCEAVGREKLDASPAFQPDRAVIPQEQNQPQELLQSSKQVKRSKIRSSCTACSHAKIRCDKGQPSCGRCVRVGQTCNYILSRRNGRPPVKRCQSPSSVFTKESILSPRHGVPEDNDRRQRSNEEFRSSMAHSPTIAPAVLSFNEFSLPDVNQLLDSVDIPFGDAIDALNHDLCSTTMAHPSFDFRHPGLESMTTPTTSTPPSSTPASRASGSSWPTTSPLRCEDLAETTGDTGQHECNCIPQLLAAFTLPLSSGEDNSHLPANTAAAPPPSLPPPRTALDVCNQVLACPCLSYEERSISLLSFVILNHLLREAEGDAAAFLLPDSHMLVTKLARRLRACQPRFARTQNHVFAQFWLATIGCSG